METRRRSGRLTRSPNKSERSLKPRGEITRGISQNNRRGTSRSPRLPSAGVFPARCSLARRRSEGVQGELGGRGGVEEGGLRLLGVEIRISNLENRESRESLLPDAP